ncbi:MAG TPA: hypothetical protein VL240_02225 [Candidatus Binatia bacterium]|nr:hypothetical protein [Candidatus Binatia bacterium]
MAFKYCQHVKENGTFCSSGALKGRKYCYFHSRLRARRLAMAQAQSQRKPWRLELPPLEDMHAVQMAIIQVVEALAARAVDERRAGLMLYGLQQAASNIRAVHAWLMPSRFELDPDDELRAASYPGLEAEFGLPEKVDLDAAPEEVFPPATRMGYMSQAEFDRLVAAMREAAAAPGPTAGDGAMKEASGLPAGITAEKKPAQSVEGQKAQQAADAG